MNFFTDVEQDENIDPNNVFEHVRQLLLNRKVTEAVTYLWKTCTKLEEAPEMESLSAAAKEECLFTFLLKIFIESEDKNANDAGNSEQDNNMKEELRLRKRVINYLNVRDIKMNIAIFLNCCYCIFFLCRIVWSLQPSWRRRYRWRKNCCFLHALEMPLNRARF